MFGDGVRRPAHDAHDWCMRQHEDGHYAFDPDEVKVLRAALFVTRYHRSVEDDDLRP
jgi:hypothetical protein